MFFCREVTLKKQMKVSHFIMQYKVDCGGKVDEFEHFKMEMASNAVKKILLNKILCFKKRFLHFD